MSNVNALRAGEVAMREDSLNNTLDRSIENLEKELSVLENIAGGLDGNPNPTPAGKPESKPLQPSHSLWKARHLENLIAKVGEFAERIHGNIAG